MLGKRLGMAQARAEAEAPVFEATDFNRFQQISTAHIISHMSYVFGSSHEAAQSQSSEAAQQQEAGERESEELQLCVPKEAFKLAHRCT